MNLPVTFGLKIDKGVDYHPVSDIVPSITTQNWTRVGLSALYGHILGDEDILSLIVGRTGQIANFGKKTPQIHLIIIRE